MKKEMSLYFHIGNGGVSVTVESTDTGPMVRMDALHFGHPTGSVGVYVGAKDLTRLAEFFSEAAAQEYRRDYVCSAEPGVLYIDGARMGRSGEVEASGPAIAGCVDGVAFGAPSLK